MKALGHKISERRKSDEDIEQQSKEIEKPKKAVSHEQNKREIDSQ